MTQTIEHKQILQQRGKTFTGYPNPVKTSLVSTIYHNESGRQVCSAIKSNKEICESVMILSSGRCKSHGGQSPKGMEASNFKTGRHSKFLPDRLAARYEEALSDPDLHNLDAEIALIDARIADLLAQTDAGGGGEIFKEADEAFRSFTFGSQDGDKKMMRESLRKLEDALARGRGEGVIWHEIHQLQEQRRKLVLSQAKVAELKNQTVTVTRVNLLISALLAAVREEVSDRSVLSRISEKFQRIVQAGSNQPKSLK